MPQRTSSRRVHFDSRRTATVTAVPEAGIPPMPAKYGLVFIIAPLVPLAACLAMLGHYLAIGAP